MRCDARLKRKQSKCFHTWCHSKHLTNIENATKYRNRKLLEKYCYYQAEGRDRETQRDRKREWERESEMQTIDLACSRGAKKTFCITITHTDRIIIECERDVENEIGIAQATRRSHETQRHSWRETKPNWFHFATKLSNTKINQMMTKKQRQQRRRRRRWWRFSDDDDDDLAPLSADLQVHHSALAVAANYSNNNTNSSRSSGGSGG